jgi:hypothetical protein
MQQLMNQEEIIHTFVPASAVRATVTCSPTSPAQPSRKIPNINTQLHHLCSCRVVITITLATHRQHLSHLPRLRFVALPATESFCATNIAILTRVAVTAQVQEQAKAEKTAKARVAKNARGSRKDRVI